MLEAELRRVGVPLDMRGREVIDVMAIYFQKEPRDLKAALRFYCETEHANAHSALADAYACRDVLQGQIRMYTDLPNTPTELSAVLMERTKKKTLDSGGWFETRHGKPAFSRGKHQGMSIENVAPRRTGLPAMDADDRPAPGHHKRDQERHAELWEITAVQISRNRARE